MLCLLYQTNSENHFPIISLLFSSSQTSLQELTQSLMVKSQIR